MKEINDRLDEEIIEGLKDIIPPEGEIQSINPWSRPIGLIIWGLILTNIQLNFLYLNYSLPTLGVILNFLGFRSLRNENKYFKSLWLISIVRLFMHIVDLIIIASPLNLLVKSRHPISIFLAFFHIAIFPIFHLALKEVYKESDKTMESAPLLWVSLWSVLVIFIALSPLSSGSWLVFIPMMIFYILIIRSLFSISEDLDEIGYNLENAAVKVNNRTFGWYYFIFTMLVTLTINAYSNNLKLEAEEFFNPIANLAREKILEMGFPQEALRYLKDGDIVLLEDAINVEVISNKLMFDSKEIEHKEDFGVENQYIISYEEVPGKKNIDTWTIYIEMPGNTLYVMQLFQWTGGKPFWQDGISITGKNDLDNREIIDSGLFYKKKNKEYRADFPRIDLEEIEVTSFFGIERNQTIRGALSYPFNSKEQGGYIFYRYGTMESDIYFMPHLFKYLHQSFPIRMPYVDVEDLLLVGSFDFRKNSKSDYTTYGSTGRQEINKEIEYELIED